VLTFFLIAAVFILMTY